MKRLPVFLWAATCATTLLELSALAVPVAPVKAAGLPAAAATNAASTAGFSLAVSPASVTLTPGGVAQKLTVVAFAQNGFNGTITVKTGSLPSGIAVTPASFTVAAGSLRVVSIAASSAAKPGTASIHLAGNSSALKGSTAFTVSVQAPPSASLSTTFFNFGNDLVKHTLAQTVTAVTNTGSSTLTMNPVLTGDASYSIVSAKSCSSELAPGHTCDMEIKYLPATPSATKAQSALLNMHFGHVAAGTPQTVAITGTSAALPLGVVTATDNPQVALYTMMLPFPGRMKVSFGETAAYGLSTWAQSTDTAGGNVSIFVAGMLENTAYHMRATVELSNGVTAVDQDHKFTTGSATPKMILNLTAATTAGMTPQPGLELVNPISGVAITDLAGHMLWAYSANTDAVSNPIYGVKMLEDGNILMTIGALSEEVYTAPPPENEIVEIREVNLGGDTVKETSIDDLNEALSTATCAECNVSLLTFHHDVTALPNGHWLVLANTLMDLSPTTTPPLTHGVPQPVLGDVIVDLDRNLQPVWAWNEFNHLDPNRQPMGFPDWTHTNAILYSPDDGNILVSSRHQNWVLKVDYANGAGKGDILWHLGEGGEFKLEGGTDPSDWEYAQHGPAFTSANTSGVFSMALMDNGDDRIFATGVKCGTSGAPPCLYTTVSVFKIDEVGKTATLTFHQKLSAGIYNPWGGNAEQLANGDLEFDDCGLTQGSYVYEVTQDTHRKTVWEMHVTNTDFYRAFRIPSMYPGVQW
jgi:arylsulfate sulfotransferase